jgi:branched-chain amino acid transport system substrate-binding protein
MKKTLALLLAALMALSVFAGCAQTPAPAQTTAAPAATTAAPAATSGAATTAPAPAAKILVVGNMQDLTGAASINCNAINEGLQAFVKMANEKKLFKDGTQVEIITYDYKGDIKESVNVYTRLATQDKVPMMFGPPVSNVGNAIKTVNDQYKVPILATFVDPACFKKEDGSLQQYAFLSQPSNNAYGTMIATYAMNDLGLKTFGTIYDKTNSYAVSLAAPFAAYVEAHGGKILASEAIQSSDKDFKTQLGKIMKANPDAIFSPSWIQEQVGVVKQAYQLGWKKPILASMEFSPPFVEKVGDPNVTDNLYFLDHWSLNDPLTKQVHDDYVAINKKEPINKYYLGYDYGLILQDILKRVPDFTPESFTKALSETKDVPITQGASTFSIDPKTHLSLGIKMIVYNITKGVYKEIKKVGVEG